MQPVRSSSEEWTGCCIRTMLEELTRSSRPEAPQQRAAEASRGSPCLARFGAIEGRERQESPKTKRVSPPGQTPATRRPLGHDRAEPPNPHGYYAGSYARGY